MTRAAHQDNARAWDQAAGAYRKNIDKTLQFLRDGGVSMCAPERAYLQDLSSWCVRAIHLQCAGGEDTLSLLNLGAREVIGIDISSAMIEVAQQTSDRLGCKANWVVSDVLYVPSALNESADLVYTGQGALNWVHDLTGWAKTVARLLKKDGLFYMFEGHPITYAFDARATSLVIDPHFEGYFSRKIYSTNDWTPEYVGDLGLRNDQMAHKHEVAWPVSDVITTLVEQGLRLVRFEEHPDAYWTEFPNLPDHDRKKIPNTYSLSMRRA